MQKVLVTGAGGFIGRYLCGILMNEGYFVRGVVRSTNNQLPVNGSHESCHVGEVGENTDWRNPLADIDVVIHLAATAHVLNDADGNTLAEIRTVNTLGTERLAYAAVEAGVRRIVYVSSVKANGDKTGAHPFTELAPPRPKDPYGASKWEAEKRLLSISKKAGIEIVVLRPPLVYGPGVKANFLQLMKLVNKGIPLPLTSIQNRRSLIYLGNLVDALVMCISHPKAAGQTYLVSDGDDVSTPELIRRIADALGKPERLFPFPPLCIRLAGTLLGKSDALEKLLGSLTVDSGKIRRELEWKAPYTMMQGLKITAEWFAGFKS